MDAIRKCAFDWSRGIVNWQSPRQSSNEFSILAVGDILFNADAERIIAERGRNFIFGPTKQIFRSADVIIGNLETPLSNKGKQIVKCGPNLRASPSLAKVLADTGFTVLGVANNHIRDYGDIAVLDTLHHLRSQGVFAVGGGADEVSSWKPVVLKVKNKSIGIFAFTYQQESVAKKDRPGAADLENPKCFEIARSYSDQVDVLLVFLHMGLEFSNYPAPPYVELARRFIDVGADCVVGNHPHVPQGLEIYKGKLIAYSLGNFISPWKTMLAKSPYVNLGYMLELVWNEGGIAVAKIIPYKISCFFQSVPLTGRERTETIKHLERISRVLLDYNLLQVEWGKTAIKEVKGFLYYFLAGKCQPMPVRFLAGLKSIRRPQLKHCYTASVRGVLKRVGTK